MRSWFALALALVPVACGKAKPGEASGSAATGSGSAGATSSTPARGPVAITIRPAPDSTSDVECTSELGKGTYGLETDGHALATISGPAGSTVAIQGLTVKLADRPTTVGIDLVAAGMSGVVGKPFAIDVAVTPAGATTPTIATMSCDGKKFAERTLERVKLGPVAFADDASAKFPKDVLALFIGDKANMFYEAAIGTEGALLHDVDLVALRVLSTRHDSCGMYGGGSTRAELTRSGTDADDEVWDRRTGKRIAQKHFAATMVACPSSTEGEVGATNLGEMAANWDETAEKAWLASLLAARPAGAREIDPAPPKAIAATAAGAFAFTDDPGTGFPTAANLPARMKRAGFPVKQPPDAPTGWPVYVSATGGTDGWDVRLYDFGGAAKRKVPNAIHFDDTRAIWIEGSTADAAPAIKAGTAALASFHGTTYAELDRWAHANGYTGKNDYPDTTFETSEDVRRFGTTLQRGSTYVTIDVASWAHLAGGKSTSYAFAREGERMLLVGVGIADVPQAQAVLDKLVK